MTVSLLQLSTTDCEALATGRIPARFADRVALGAIPPPFVAVRSLKIAAEGHPTPWSTTFLIVRNEDGNIVGGCGFKNFPSNGRVEVGYGVAPSAQGQGVATAALNLLVKIGFDAGANEIFAEIIPSNLGSTRVVQKMGFVLIGSYVDDENELVNQWIKRCELA